MSDRQFIFAIAPGQSGTAWLTEFLRLNLPGDAAVHHHRTGFQSLGVDSPDASHFTRFNSIGNDPRVQAFWTEKTRRLIRSRAPVVAELSHHYARAGLVENLAPLTRIGRVDLIALDHSIGRVLWSLVNRMEFHDPSYTWLNALDPRYPNVIVNPRPFMAEGAAGQALWFIHEMRTRAAYYAMLLAGAPNIRLHRVTLAQVAKADGAAALLSALGRGGQEPRLPPPGTVAPAKDHFGQEMRDTCTRLIGKFRVDHADLAATYFNAGRRLELGPKRRLSAPPDTRVH